jgi:hypothetical protein
MQSNSIVSRRFAFTRLNSPCARSAAKSSHPTAHHSVVRSSGMSPNLRMALASPKSPVAGSPERLKATAPTMPGLRESALAFITAAFGLKHSTASPATAPSAATKGRGMVGHLAHLSRPCACFAHPTARDPPRAVQPDTQGLRVWLPPRSDRRVRPTLPAGPSEACRPLGLAAPS